MPNFVQELPNNFLLAIEGNCEFAQVAQVYENWASKFAGEYFLNLCRIVDKLKFIFIFINTINMSMLHYFILPFYLES